ncbi:MAG TPA: alpha-glucosidase, partial [Acidisarcina sp.]
MVLVLSLTATGQRVELNRGGATVVLEPYGPNIIRVTLSMLKDAAEATPGYGVIGAPAADGWQQSHGEDGDTYKSSRMVVTVEADHPGHPVPSEVDIAKFFRGSAPGVHIVVRTPTGKVLTDMQGWAMSDLNYKDGTMDIAADRRPTDAP